MIENYTEQEIIAIINQIAKRLAPKYKFSYVDEDDIIQECYFIGMEAISRYDGRVPLVNFLSVHINNRLKNFKRDNYYRPFKCPHCESTCEFCQKKMSQRETKKNLLEPIDVGEVRDENESRMKVEQCPSESVEIDEILLLIDQCLPFEYREDYLKYKSGAKLPTARKRRIEELILEILS